MPLIIAFIAVFAAGNLSGWMVHSWKAGAQVALIKSEKKSLEERNETLAASNGQCKTDVQSVQKGVESLTSYYEGKVKAAQAEAVKAQPIAAKHTQAAITIIAAPVREGESMCAAIEREQKEYVQARHTNS